MRLISILSVVLCAAIARGQPAKQNPSPMVERTREHPRLKEERPPGKRIALKIGTLFLPEKLPKDAPLFLHFHGGSLIPEIAAARNNAAVIGIQLGNGSWFTRSRSPMGRRSRSYCRKPRRKRSANSSASA